MDVTAQFAGNIAKLGPLQEGSFRGGEFFYLGYIRGI